MQTRKELFEHLKNEAQVLENLLIQDAFESIDRADFVPEDYKVEAYEDYPIPIGFDQTISQPTTVAFMLEKLDAKPGDSVLDIGSGSGWSTALLSQIVGSEGKVLGIERIPELVKIGNENISSYNFKKTSIELAGDSLGKPEETFDRILVSAGSDDERVLEFLLSQLSVGGNLVIPIEENIVVLKKVTDMDVEKEEYPGFMFVPLIQNNQK